MEQLQHPYQNTEELQTPIQSKIDEILGWYGDEYLQNGEKYRFSQLTDRSDRIDDACWNLAAQKDKDIHLFNKAVNLRTLHMLGWMEKQSHALRADEEIRFDLGYHDDFWSSVDSALKSYIRRFTDHPYNGEVVESRMPDRDMYLGRQTLGFVNGMNVIRETVRPVGSDTLNHVAYIVQAPRPETDPTSR